MTVSKFTFNLERHQRHLLLSNFSGVIQEGIANACVVIVGLGGLGSNTAIQLAAAGVGKLFLIDYDVVEVSNLPRQLAYEESNIGKLKTLSLQERINKINSEVQVEFSSEKFSLENSKLFSEANIIVDALDNVSDKLLLADVAFKAKLPLVHAGVIAMQGQATTLMPEKTACLRCAFPNLQGEELSCSSVGVYAPLCQFLSCLQVSEVMQILMGNIPPLSGKIYFVTAPNFLPKVISVAKRFCQHNKASNQ